MATNALVRARIDEKLKDEAAMVLAEMGLTVSDLVRITLTRVAREKALPFELKLPNAETRAAMAESRAMMKARHPRYANAEQVFDALEQKVRR